MNFNYYPGRAEVCCLWIQFVDPTGLAREGRSVRPYNWPMDSSVPTKVRTLSFRRRGSGVGRHSDAKYQQSVNGPASKSNPASLLTGGLKGTPLPSPCFQLPFSADVIQPPPPPTLPALPGPGSTLPSDLHSDRPISRCKTCHP